jgi:hypothetical protein
LELLIAFAQVAYALGLGTRIGTRREAVILEVLIRSCDGIETGRRRVEVARARNVESVLVGWEGLGVDGQCGQGRTKDKDRRKGGGQALHDLQIPLREVF